MKYIVIVKRIKDAQRQKRVKENDRERRNTGNNTRRDMKIVIESCRQKSSKFKNDTLIITFTYNVVVRKKRTTYKHVTRVGT